MKPIIESVNFHGLEALRLTGPDGAQAVIALQGAQVLSWRTPDGRERLYLSDKAVFDGSVPVRGGIPVCFPQFASLGPLPKHGFVRTRAWRVATQRCGDDYALVTLETSDDAATQGLWPHAFRLELTLMLEAGRIDLELCVANPGEAPFAFTGALHSYLRVVQVEDIALEGLRGYDYRDAANGDRIVRETGTELLVEGETDRAYFNAKRPLLLKAANLSTGIAQEGFPDVVVWNPWVERCAAMADMPADGWRHMLCVEAAVARNPVTVAAGEEWYGRQTLVAV
jgi:glucose-6-phosphate 1-epimerase